MDNDELVSHLRNFEAVAVLSERLRQRASPLARILCALYAMWCAFRIRLCLGTEHYRDEDHRRVEPAEEWLSGSTLPNPSSVRCAGEILLSSIKLNDRSTIARELEQMGIFSLCPNLPSQFTRMRQIAALMTRETQVVALAELALFAVEVEDYEHASEIAAEARLLNPTEWEMYSVYIVEGLVAFHKGDFLESARLMRESTIPCQCDEYASLDCGVRGLNLSLPGKLLSVGMRSAVSEYLVNCRDVWRSLRPQIDVWISLLKDGETPDFGASRTVELMNTPSFRLMMQWARVVDLEENPSKATDRLGMRRTRTEILAARERMRAEHKRADDAGERPRSPF